MQIQACVALLATFLAVGQTPSGNVPGNAATKSATASVKVEIAGPGLKYVGRKASYVVKLSNPGEVPVRRVVLTYRVPELFHFLTTTDVGRFSRDTRIVTWKWDELLPGETKEVRVEAKVLSPGESRHKAEVTAEGGLKAATEIATRSEGLNDYLLEITNLDTIEVGAEDVYEVRMTNVGAKAETNVQLTCVIPDQMEFTGAAGPVPYHVNGKNVVFDRIAKLPPKADAIFHVTVKIVSAGRARFKAEMTCDQELQPVVEVDDCNPYVPDTTIHSGQ